jgi:hypothetical protein
VRNRLPLSALAPALVICAACAVAALPRAVAQEKEPGKDKIDEKAELAEFLADAKKYDIRTTGKQEVAFKLRESALLNFTNPERNQECGSVFVWLDPDGRPAVMGQFFWYSTRAGARLKKHAMHSLAPVELEAKYGDRAAWTPDRAGVEWKAFPEAPAVGANKRERLSQMKQLAQAFKVTLTDPRTPDKPTELRRLDSPLFAYAAPKQGVTDGAIFSYVVATDPEAILLVEAFDEKGKTGFRYAFARFHFWRLTATLADKAVWDVGHDPSMTNNPLATPANMKKVYNSYNP